MISIRKFLNAQEGKPNDAFERMSHLLLQAIGRHAVDGDENARNTFQSVIEELEKDVTDDASPGNVLITTSAVVKAMENYNRRNSARTQVRQAELQSMVGMLTQAMSQISNASETSITRLQELQHLIEGAAMVENISTLKTRLSECLQSIRSESKRQLGESERLVAELQTGLKKSQARQLETPAAGSDPIAGLPQRLEAEAALEAACGDDSHTYAALFLVERIESIKARFGRDIGEQVEVRFYQRVVTGLRVNDRFFRWSKSAFLVLLQRDESGEHVRREITAILSRPFDQTFELTGRSVVLPISSTWLAVSFSTPLTC